MKKLTAEIRGYTVMAAPHNDAVLIHDGHVYHWDDRYNGNSGIVVHSGNHLNNTETRNRSHSDGAWVRFYLTEYNTLSSDVLGNAKFVPTYVEAVAVLQ